MAVDLVLAFGALGHALPFPVLLPVWACCTGSPHGRRAAGADPEGPSTFPAMKPRWLGYRPHKVNEEMEGALLF
jgi:hypothetical protein